MSTKSVRCTKLDFKSLVCFACFSLNIYITRRHHSESVRKEICNTQKAVINKTERMFHEPIKDKCPMTRINRLTSFFIPYKHPLNALSVRIFTEVFPLSSHTRCQSIINCLKNLLKNLFYSPHLPFWKRSWPSILNALTGHCYQSVLLAEVVFQIYYWFMTKNLMTSLPLVLVCTYTYIRIVWPCTIPVLPMCVNMTSLSLKFKTRCFHSLT